MRACKRCPRGRESDKTAIWGGFWAVRALTSRLIFLAGVKWSCLRIDEPAFPPVAAVPRRGKG